MHFAKLFTYKGGQLLVTWHNSDDADHESAPYLLTTETRAIDGSGVTTRLEHGYVDQAKRDADFEAFGDDKAEKLYQNQQKFMTRMSEPT